ncbi:hypothetical protein CLV62_1425 [Dysgonomonas alginatilytica]|uniref:DUF4435 domain-containing protein n=1 Tax=Dysgonomonas alginatilytica TaxID=1605892 RepID=A0A2V3PIR9_9BACT|nr:DUF4435 domain-containing protein [Dysgonomonas alginatilytica]PXV58858.1 hypothetical protein CLV62_1425 [Dysgonomonas alginatilytica]
MLSTDTQSFNIIPNLHSKAIGIIDTDHRVPSQLSSLKDKGVYSLPYAEIENLFLDEDFLKLFAAKYDHEEKLVEAIKQEIINTLELQKELQISNYITSKVNHYFSESHVNKANTKDEIIQNFKEFKSKINIDTWYEERNAELDKIIRIKDYTNAIKVFNNKGLSTIANKHFKISNFRERALYFLKHNYEVQNAILKSFPIDINAINV